MFAICGNVTFSYTRIRKHFVFTVRIHFGILIWTESGRSEAFGEGKFNNILHKKIQRMLDIERFLNIYIKSIF